MIKLTSKLQDRLNIVKSMRTYTIGIEKELGKKKNIKLEIKENFQICELYKNELQLKCMVNY